MMALPSLLTAVTSVNLLLLDFCHKQSPSSLFLVQACQCNLH